MQSYASSLFAVHVSDFLIMAAHQFQVVNHCVLRHPGSAELKFGLTPPWLP